MVLKPIFQIYKRLSSQIFTFIINFVIPPIIDMQGFVLEVQFFKKLFCEPGIYQMIVTSHLR